MYEADVLIFCPNIDGHRQIYCSVLTRFFIKSGKRVLIAAGSSGQYSSIENEAHILKNLMEKHSNDVKLLDLHNTKNTHKIHGYWNEMVQKLEAESAVNLTIFPTGDELKFSLENLGYPINPDIKRVAIFIRYDWLYPGYLHKYNKENQDLKYSNNLQRIKNKCREFRDKRKRRNFLLEDVWKSLGLDSILCTNPDFMERYADKRFIYLPEIYRDWDDILSEDNMTIRKYLDKWDNFYAGLDGKRILFYYGGWSARRGYDLLLRLAIEDERSVFVSYSRPSIDDNFEFNIDEMKRQLEYENRIFEAVIPFLPHNILIDKLFNSIDFLILPYRYWHGLSGVLIQSTEYKKPVMVPAVGYMNSIVNQYNIGLTYSPCDFAELKKCYNQMCDCFQDYSERVQNFSKGYGKQSLYRTLEELL